MKLNRPEFLLCVLKTEWLLMRMVISPTLLFLLSGRHSRAFRSSWDVSIKWKMRPLRSGRTADGAPRSPSSAGPTGQPRHAGFGLIGLSALC